MKQIYLLTALHVALYSCFTGSKVVLSLLALDMGASQVLVGLLVACYAVAPLTLGVFSGRLADTIGMRAPMLIGAAFMGAAMLTSYLWHVLAALYVTALVSGIGVVFFVVSTQNLAGALPGNRTRNYSVLAIGYSLANLIGPLLAGYSIEYGGHITAFLIFAAFTLPPILMLAAYGGLTRVDTPKAPAAARRAADLVGITPLRRLIVISGLQMAAWDLYNFYVPVYGHSIGLHPSTIGIILGAFAAATFVIRFALAWLTERWRTEAVLAGAMVFAGALMLLFPMMTHPLPLVVTSFAIGLGLGCGHPLSMALAFERSPPGRSGEVTGLRIIATNLARFVVPLIAGSLGAALGAAAVFWMNAVNLGATAQLARISHKREK